MKTPSGKRYGRTNMSYKWELKCYCDVCGAEKHFKADNMSDCIYKAQHEGWYEYPNRVVACEKCKKEVEKHYGRTSRI